MISALGFPEALVGRFSLAPAEIYWIRTHPCSLSQCHCLLYSLFEYNLNTRGRGMRLVLPDQCLSSDFSKSVDIFSVLPAILISYT